MKIDRTQRIILWNQFQILKLLGEKNPDLDLYQKILNNGYEIEYSQIYGGICSETVSKEVCSEVYDILSMWRAFEFETTTEFKKTHKRNWFDGFDGNEEGDHYSFCNFLFNDAEKFDELKKYGANSHYRRLDTYRRMLAKFKRLSSGSSKLTDEIAEKIIS